MTSACAPATPAPQNSATVLAAFKRSASASTCSGAGVATARATATELAPVACAARRWNTSPEIASTDTPPRPSACWTAVRATRGICSAWLTSSQYSLQSTNTRSGCVSWKKPVPTSLLGMCEAIASTGAPVRCAS